LNSIKEAYISNMRSVEMVMIPDSQHMTPLDQPEWLNGATKLFLDRQA